MSIPSPKFDDLRQNFLKDLSSFRRRLGLFKADACRDRAVKIIKGIEKDYSACDYLDSQRRLNDLSFDTAMKIGRLFKLISPIVSEDSVESVKLELKNLRDEVFIFKDMAPLHNEIDEKGLEPFLKMKWAKAEFVILVTAGQPWAVAKLKEMLEQGKESAFVFLIGIAPHKYHLQPLLKTYVEHPQLVELIEFFLDEDPDKKEVACWAIMTILQDSDCKWLSQLIVKRLDDLEDVLVQRLFKKIVWKHMGQYPWIQDTMIKNLENPKPWAVSLTCSYFAKVPNRACLEFMVVILERACSRSVLQENLAAISVVVGSDSPFRGLIYKYLKDFKDLRSGFGHSFSSQLGRIERSQLDLDLELVSGKGNLHYADFVLKNCSDLFKVNVFRMLMRSEQNLIRVLTGKANPVEFVDPPISKCFPKVKAVLVGALRNGNDIMCKILVDMATILEHHGVSVHCPTSSSRRIKGKHRNIKFIDCTQHQTIWLQDSHLVHEGGIRYPCLTLYNRKNRLCMEEDRKRRVPLEKPKEDILDEKAPSKVSEKPAKSSSSSSPFCAMGAVMSHLSQFSFLEAMMTKDLMAVWQSINFTYNEGGNCLIGEHEGKRYAIIGKDALALNKKLLADRLSEIGLNKDDDGRWVIGDPYNPKDCRIDDEDIKLLISLDLGLESPDLCYFTEQPEFHLDMAMTILKDKTVLLSDSTQSVRVIDAYVTEMLHSNGVQSQEYLETLGKRVAVFKEEASKRKIFEDCASRDLLQQGFKVARAPGIFRDITKSHPENHKINFFNFISLTTPDDKRLILALGCGSFFKSRFEKIIREHLDDVDEIYFLNRGDSEFLLSKGGGVHCITKLLQKEP